jgi:hypothetical protein
VEADAAVGVRPRGALEAGVLAEVLEAALDQAVREVLEMPARAVDEGQRVAVARDVEPRQQRVGIQFQHLGVDRVLDPLEEVERVGDAREERRVGDREPAEQVMSERADQVGHGDAGAL